jgi:cysteinyl-tRNA synthetase
LEEDLGSVLGIGRLEPSKALSDIEAIRAARLSADGVSRPAGPEIEAMIQARNDARKAKNFAESDRIRVELESRGVLLKDSSQGTAWHYK